MSPLLRRLRGTPPAPGCPHHKSVQAVMACARCYGRVLAHREALRQLDARRVGETDGGSLALDPERLNARREVTLDLVPSGRESVSA